MLIGLILLQEGKSGDLITLDGTSADGIHGVTNPIRRATAWMAAIFFILATALGIFNRPTVDATKLLQEAEANAATTTTTTTPTSPNANVPAPTIAPPAPPTPPANVTPAPTT